MRRQVEKMTLNEWAKEIHDNAVAHGWWEDDRSLSEILMLIVSELAEALEEARAGRPMVWHMCTYDGKPCDVDDCTAGEDDDGDCAVGRRYEKPEGIAVEVIDALIRILDWCGKEGLDVDALVREKHEYNKTRPYKHGKKF